MRTAKQSQYLPGQKDKDVYEREIDNDVENLFNVFKGRVRFGDGTASGDRGENMAGKFFEFTTDATPGTTNTVTHDFTAESKGAIVLEQDIAGHLITDSKTTTTTLFKSDVASVTFRIFLLK